ncbi:MAG: hypothetical protein EAZ13_07035 [Sphingobacteriia bacterium]|nr:MAG: hypothetical protein EAZ13_07035 [Sphingobacteriia bacterium]
MSIKNILLTQDIDQARSFTCKPFTHFDFTEAQKLASRIGDYVTLLNGNFIDFLKELHTLGEVVAVTGNNHCKVEHIGVYRNISFEGDTSFLYGNEMDLQFFLPQWKFGFAVDENDRLSFQFFDKSGRAVHKIFLTEYSTRSAWFRLMALYKTKEKKYAATGIQDFFYTAKNHIAFNTIPPLPEIAGFVKQVNNNTLENILFQCTVQNIAVKLIVANHGCTQLYNGMIQNLQQTNSFYKVIGHNMNMRLQRMAIADSYIVRMPVKNGVMSYLEIFGEDGNRVLRLRGKQNADGTESTGWTNILRHLS